MTAPDELVQAVHDALVVEHYFNAGPVLAAVPDGWAKIDGEWRQLSPLAEQLVRGNVKEVRRD